GSAAGTAVGAVGAAGGAARAVGATVGATVPTMTRRLAPILCLLHVGCEGVQSALAPAGPIAHEIAALWWGMAIAAALIFAVVLTLLLHAVQGAPDRRWRVAPRRLIYAGGIALPIITLSV